jgi:hypothetical protein
VDSEPKGKLPLGTAMSIGGKGKVVRAEDLLGLSEWVPPMNLLEQAYRWDRQVFFLLVNVQPETTLTHRQFERIWTKAVNYGKENLLAEILVRGELNVEDPVKAYWMAGDLGARILLYKAEQEFNQSEKRRTEQAMAISKRQLSCDHWTLPIMTGFNRYQAQWDAPPLMDWRQ